MIDESSGNEWLMPVRSRGRPRYLIQNRKVSADYAIGLIVVVEAQNGKPVLGGVKDMRVPRFLGQRVNGNAWDFALGKLTEARTGKDLDWCAILNAFDISLWDAGHSLRRPMNLALALHACSTL